MKAPKTMELQIFMLEAVTRAKGLLNLAMELGFKGLSNVIQIGTDSNAAKSFVSRRGLGRMRHLEIRDLWLQAEVEQGRLVVHKVKGDQNAADLMTKVLSLGEVVDRLGWINLWAETTEEEGAKIHPKGLDGS